MSTLLLWIGIALLANLGWGIGLLGIGILLLGEQAARQYAAAKFETFWVVVGVTSPLVIFQAKKQR